MVSAKSSSDLNFVLPRVLVKKPATRLKIPLIAFGEGHLLAARKAVRVGDLLGVGAVGRGLSSSS